MCCCLTSVKPLTIDYIGGVYNLCFDKVPHSGLFHKLQFYGIKGPLLTWIKNFFSDRSQQVVLNNKRGDSCSVLSGVPQGNVLAPLLF